MMKVSYIFFISFIFSLSVHAQTAVEGKLTGSDGKPMSMAYVFLTHPIDDKPVNSVKVEKNGKYNILINSDGLWILHFTGTFHHEYQIAIYAKGLKNINLDVKLQTYKYSKFLAIAKVIGNFNDWSMPKAVSLKEDKDGTYSAEIDNKLDTLVYRIINVRAGGKVEGTEADGYIPTGVDSKGIEGYNSFIVGKKGKVKIVFDPKKLISSDVSTSFKFTPDNSFESKFARAYSILEDSKQKYKINLYSHLADHKWGSKFNFKPFIDTVEHLLKGESDDLIRQVYQLSYFWLKYMNELGNDVDFLTSRETLKIIPPGSVIWSLDTVCISSALKHSSMKDILQEKFIYNVLDTNPVERTKTILLRDEIEKRFIRLEESKIIPMLSILLDQYGDSPEAKIDGKKYFNYVHVKRGEKAPEFSVKLLQDSTKHITNNNFKGKYCLLEFMSSTSSACKDEIVNLKKAYDKYSREKLDIVTISLDSSAVDAAKFIRENVEVPCFNAIEEKGLDSKLCKNFEVYSFPKAVLINPEGIISAVGWDLHSKNFLNTMKKYLGE